MSFNRVSRGFAAVLVAASVTAPIVAASPANQQQQQRIRVGGNIPEPKKIKNVPPVYPQDARDAKIQGIVIIETVIGTDGSITEAKVLRSVPELDKAAVDAVLQWKYTPTLLNGEPVEVIMTVTVTFTLS
jgi:protein TonB